MICKICNKEIPRGQRYKSERYKNISFCSEQCYNRYIIIQDKKNGSKNALKDYINNLFTEPNWPLFMRQISNLEQEFNLSDSDLKLIIKYAIEYEHHSIDEKYGLGQFEPYIKPAMKFCDAIRNSRTEAEEIEIEQEINVIKQSKFRKFRQNIEFD